VNGTVVLNAAALREARDPTALPDRLERLARHRERAVRAAVVANPNTSLTVLSRLGAAFGIELAANPLLGWLHVENADFLASLPALVRHRLLTVAEPGLLWWAARFGTEDDKRALLTNPKVPVDLLQWLDQHDSDDIKLLARDHIAFPGPIDASIVHRVLPSAGAGDFEELVSMGLVPTWMLPSAVHASDVDVRRLVAARPELSASDVEVLLFDADDRVRTVAAQHPAAPVDVLAFLLALDDLTVALPTVPPLVFDRLLGSADGQARLGQRSDLPSEMAASMAAATAWTVRRAIAASPSLPADVAFTLALDLDRDVRAAVAANPHAPADVVALLRSDDDSIVRDACPAGAAAEVSRAELGRLEQDGERGRVLAAAQANAGRTRLARLAIDPNWKVRRACARNPMTSPAVLSRLAGDGDRDVRAAAAGNPTTAVAVCKRLAADGDDLVRASVAATTRDRATLRLFADETDSTVRAAALGNDQLDDDLVLTFILNGESIVRRAAAKRAGLTIDALAELVETDDDDVRLALLRRPDFPDGMVARLLPTNPELAGDAGLLVRRPEQLAPERIGSIAAAAPWIIPAIVDRTDLPGVVLALGASPEWRLRQQAAQAAGADHVELLRSLSADPDHDVRQAVARNPFTPADIVERLTTDDSVLVRRAALQRPDLPSASVIRLTGDDDAEVRSTALGHPSCPTDLSSEQLALDEGRTVSFAVLRAAASGAMPRRLAVAHHPLATTRLLAGLAKDDYWQVREAVAGNANASVVVLTRLAGDSDRDVRRAVAAHANTPTSVLDTLVSDGSDIVRKQALIHPNLAGEGRGFVLSALARRSTRSSSVATRTAAAASPFIPVSDLRHRRQWQSLDWWVRYGVAVNERAPHDVLECLADDGHVAVRAAARAQLMRAMS
jgi:hypothetical protein